MHTARIICAVILQDKIPSAEQERYTLHFTVRDEWTHDEDYHMIYAVVDAQEEDEDKEEIFKLRLLYFFEETYNTEQEYSDVIIELGTLI